MVKTICRRHLKSISRAQCNIRASQYESASVSATVFKLNPDLKPFVQALVNMLSNVTASLTPFELTATIMGLSNLDTHVSTVLLEKLGEASIRHMSRLTPPELVNLAWGLSRLGHHDDVLFGKLGQEVETRNGLVIHHC